MTTAASDLSYVSHVASRSPRLTCAEELELARRFRESGDRRAADALVRANLRLVIIIALKHRHYGVPVSELVAEGNCGLVTALGKFDPARGLRFGTYAKHWVRAHVLASVIGSANLFGGRSGVRPQLFFRLRRERARIASLHGEDGTDELLAERMNMSVERLRHLLGCLDFKGIPLDATPGSEHREGLADSLASDDDPEERYFLGERRDVATKAVTVALSVLDVRERYIAERRMMALPQERPSLSEIGKTLGISRERARQLEERARRKLGRSSAIQRNAHVREWFTE
jgi:RNA polymerase sigma-32 factor